MLHDKYGISQEAADGFDRDELEDLRAALLELRGQLRKLQWYGEVNRRGFVKITKKLDKKIGQASAQQRYLETKVDPKWFANNIGLLDTLQDVNDWLSSLGDIKIHDDNSSTKSSTSIRRADSKGLLSLPNSLLNEVDQMIKADDVEALRRCLVTFNEKIADANGKDMTFIRLVHNLLQRAISCKAKECIDELLNQVPFLEEDDDINKRNCIHRLVIAMGRSTHGGDGDGIFSTMLNTANDQTNYITPAAAPVLAPPTYSTKEVDGATNLGRGDPIVVLLQYLLDRLRPSQRIALQARDTYRRMPLHYAAQYGFVVVCQIIISCMQAWGQFEVNEGIDAPFWQDSDGWSPLHLSVIGGHPLTTKTLLEAEDWRGASDRKAAVRRHLVKSGEALALATKANFVVIVSLLIEAGVNLNYQDDQGETALHVAARFGQGQCARALLQGSRDQKAETDLAENTFGWTPLFIASVDGHINVVELLIKAGADLERLDSSGWTAKEHAALRGHIDIARLLANNTLTPDHSISPSSVTSSSPPSVFSMSERKSNGVGNNNGAVRVTEPVKTFGHRYLSKESMVLVSLGTTDMRKAVEAVKLDRIPLANAHSTQLDTALSVVISASGANGEPSFIDLPVQDNISTDPIVFTTLDPTSVKLLFDIVPTYAGSKDRVVGRGVALLSSVKPSIGSKRITLQGDVTVPIVAASTLDVIGSVNFNFLIITPFTHPSMSINEKQTYWKSMSSTMVIGHRGLGKNVAGRKSLQLGENTIQSFIAAANLGASYVEFDVQLTKDHVPVIYHDFLVSETGIDAPVHTLTLEQFLHVSNKQTPRQSRPPSPERVTDPTINGTKGAEKRKGRSMSLSISTREDAFELSERMKHTRDFKKKGFKGNSRGNFIQAPFTTLEEMFKKLPESIGFNIEMSKPSSTSYS